MIDPGHPRLSIVRQCELASISRSSFYREPTPEGAENLVLMRLIDEQFLETPWYGSRQMARHLRRNGWCVGHHRVERPNQVWCTDITYIQMRRGFLYLVAIVDWASRNVLA